MAICSFIFRRLYSSGKPRVFAFFPLSKPRLRDILYFSQISAAPTLLGWCVHQSWAQKWKGGTFRIEWRPLKWPWVTQQLHAAPRGWQLAGSRGRTQPPEHGHAPCAAPCQPAAWCWRHGQRVCSTAGRARLSSHVPWNKLQQEKWENKLSWEAPNASWFSHPRSTAGAVVYLLQPKPGADDKPVY